MFVIFFFFMFFFFTDPATTEIYTLSLHDALPIWWLICPTLEQGRIGGKASFPRRTFVNHEAILADYPIQPDPSGICSHLPSIMHDA